MCLLLRGLGVCVMTRDGLYNNIETQNMSIVGFATTWLFALLQLGLCYGEHYRKNVAEKKYVNTEKAPPSWFLVT